jgi:hypothetical protein
MFAPRSLRGPDPVVVRDVCSPANPLPAALRSVTWAADAAGPEFRQAYPTRSSIERTIAWIATQNGRRVRLRYIGTARNDAWLHNRCAGLNLRTLVNAGLTRSGGAWILA